MDIKFLQKMVKVQYLYHVIMEYLLAREKALKIAENYLAARKLKTSNPTSL